MSEFLKRKYKDAAEKDKFMIALTRKIRCRTVLLQTQEGQYIIIKPILSNWKSWSG